MEGMLMIPPIPYTVKAELTADLLWPVLSPDELDRAIARHRTINEASVSLTLLINALTCDDPLARTATN
jgi:hypothetical protein